MRQEKKMSKLGGITLHLIQNLEGKFYKSNITFYQAKIYLQTNFNTHQIFINYRDVQIAKTYVIQERFIIRNLLE